MEEGVIGITIVLSEAHVAASVVAEVEVIVLFLGETEGVVEAEIGVVDNLPTKTKKEAL